MSHFSPNFFIKTLRIGKIESASCLNMGNNLPIGFQSYTKQNQGFGTINGDNNDISEIISALKDSNVIDMLNQPESDDLPDWVKKLIVAKLSND